MQDLLRFFLAIAVAIFHYKHFAIQSALSLPATDYSPPLNALLSPIYTYGYYAVDVFFFLSGYMLTLQLTSNAKSSFNYRNFLIKRLARIYPAHAATLLAMGLLAIIVNQLSLEPFITYNDDLTNFLASILLLNGTGIMRDSSFNLPAWSLSVEFICYVTFGAVCALSVKRKATIFLLALIVGATINEISSDPNTSNVGRGMIFFFGGTIAALKLKPWSDRLLPNDQIATIFLMTICVLSFFLSQHMTLGIQKLIWIFLTLPTLVILTTLIDDQVNGVKERPFIWFGLISFSIYIWHFPIQAVMHYLLHDLNLGDTTYYNSSLFFALYIVTVIAIAHTSLVTIEKWGSRCIGRYQQR